MLPYKNPTKRVGLELNNCLLYIIKQQSLARFQQKNQPFSIKALCSMQNHFSVLSDNVHYLPFYFSLTKV
jgi:hypothetical protein